MTYAFLASKEIVLSFTFTPNLVLLFLKTPLNRVLKPDASDLVNSLIWSNASRMTFHLISVFYHIRRKR